MNFENSINNSNQIVSAFITVSPFTEFTVASGNRMDFFADSLTGANVVGSYWFDSFGIAKQYAFLSSEAGSGTVYFASISLNGEPDAFYSHASSLYSDSFNPVILNELVYATETGYGQGIASWIDALPGANSWDPNSTIVSFNGENFYYA